MVGNFIREADSQKGQGDELWFELKCPQQAHVLKARCHFESCEVIGGWDLAGRSRTLGQAFEGWFKLLVLSLLCLLPGLYHMKKLLIAAPAIPLTELPFLPCHN